LEVSLNVQALNRDLACRGGNLARQTLERRRLSSAIDAEKSKALAVIESEGGLAHSFDRQTRERLVLLRKVVDLDAVNVWSSIDRLTLNHATPRFEESLAVALLASDAFLFCNDVVVFDEHGAHSLPVRAGEAADLGAPPEELVDLYLDQEEHN
jgi:hypothetical protein